MLSFLCILCIFRTIKLPAVQSAANKCGGRGGGYGGRNGRGSNARGCGNGHAKGVTPKQEEETIEHEDKEPLGEVPETIEDDIQKEKEKEANDKPKRGQTAKGGKPFKSVTPSTRKLEEMKNCSVSLERKKNKISTKKEDDTKIEVEDSCKENVTGVVKDGDVNKTESEVENKRAEIEIDKTVTEDITSKTDVDINNVQGEEVVSTDNQIYNVKGDEEIVKDNHMEMVSVYVNESQITGDLEFTKETESEKKERLGIISNSLEISNLEDKVDKELIRMGKVKDS